MANEIRVQFDISRVVRLFDDLSRNGLNQAWKTTLRKTGGWMKSQVAKAVSADSRIPQKALRSRLLFYLKQYGEKFWLGMNPIAAHRLGKTRKTRRGVTAGRFSFPGAFTFGNQPGKPAFRRVQGKVELARLEWNEAGERAFQGVIPRIEARLLKTLEQELHYRLLKEQGKI
ncbi:MAG: hypothetical protein LBD68_09850 [Zoogloeaceae bacterium]|nr:hypothetical protein [Zoogloeaceae bacterium]